MRCFQRKGVEAITHVGAGLWIDHRQICWWSNHNTDWILSTKGCIKSLVARENIPQVLSFLIDAAINERS